MTIGPVEQTCPSGGGGVLFFLFGTIIKPRPVFAQIISVRFEEIPFLFPIPVQVATPYTYKSGPLAGPPCPVSTVHLGHGLGCPSAPRPIPRGHVTPQLLAVRLELRAHCERAAVNRSKA